MITHHYEVKEADQLSAPEMAAILHGWEVEEWAGMTEMAFRHQFRRSEFHLLTGLDASLRAVARVNFDFTLRIAGVRYPFAEFVGFVAIEKRKGYGSVLLQHLLVNLRSREIEALGFCERPLRRYYEQCGLPILYDQAKHLREWENDGWRVPTDDDILDLTLSAPHARLLGSLHDGLPAYLVG